MPTIEALNLAREVGLDLVEVAPNSNPPVCRVMDYGKWKYEQKKKEHKAKQKQHQVVLKEVRIRPKIEEHDQMVKLKKAREFLTKGSKVQFTMLFKGREMAHMDLALEMMNEIKDTLADVGKVEMPPRRNGRRMLMILAPEAPRPEKPAKGESETGAEPLGESLAKQLENSSGAPA